MTELHFLANVYDKLCRGDDVEQDLARNVVNEIRWSSNGSTIRLKKVLSGSIKAIKRLPSLASPKINRLAEVYINAVNEISEFHKTPYIKGDGSHAT